MLARRCVAILEDEAARLERMRPVVSSHFPAHQLVDSDRSSAFIEIVELLWQQLDLICLDHDLPLMTHGDHVDDFGSGRDVSKYLANRSPICPVIIHSTNRAAADAMQFELADADWDVRRTVPYGDLEWIDEIWRDAITSISKSA
ncbi:cyclic-phosphate processing receiver domain-containing protein [Stratiformator vulcanicus]|uniref:Cyclic-phosphate processing Receiver domain-containing protein n=1 Tax=Stratiformator vulcanicus TaxID=2527980 RepID=A0A517R4H0_9PLAN|nr:cyclic-phosphate processing receiver domain-containing protein [Stratiformator vulcanicus]QDT38750.1 hypothetical protein Pan189_31480 [Stratiformator vulcanicus]